MSRYGTALYGVDTYGAGAVSYVVPGTGGSRRVHAHLYRATIAGVLVEDLSGDLIAGQVDFNLDRDIKLTGRFTLRNPDRVNPYTDFLAPYIHFEYDDARGDTGHLPLGLFAVRVPPGEYDINRAEATFLGEDLTSLLMTSVYLDTDNVPSGTNFAAEIAATIAEVDADIRVSLPTSTRTTGYHRTYPPGTSRLEKLHLLTDKIAWYRLVATLDGRLRSPGPYKAPSAREPVAVWTDDDLVRPLRIQPRDTVPYNVVVVLKDLPNAAPLVGIARNDDPASPSSTVATGIERVRRERVWEPETQDDVDALADRLLGEERLHYRTASLAVWGEPILGAYDAVDLALTGEMAPFSGRWNVRTWAYGMGVENAYLEVVASQSIAEDGSVL